jgi:hypothetical protein
MTRSATGARAALIATAALAVLGAAAMAAASSADRLRAAYLAGDRLELARAGWNLGAQALADELETSERERVLAALAAAPFADDAHALLLPLAELAHSPDRPVAVAAARAGLAVSREIDRDRALSMDIPTDVLDAAVSSWLELAADSGRWPDLRVHALDAAQSLARAVGLPDADDEFDLAALLADDDAELRRAALHRLPLPLSPEHQALAAAAARADPDADVTAAALQILCGGLAAGDPAAPILEALGDEGQSRLRALLLEPPKHVTTAALVDAALCAVAAGDLDSRRALSRFRGRLDDALGAVLDARLSWLE